MDIERTEIDIIERITMKTKLMLCTPKTQSKKETNIPTKGEIITPVRVPPVKFCNVTLSILKGLVCPR